MDLSLATLGLAFLAGLVTTLSPCVLPILPMVASAASGRSALGLVALAAGLATAFTVVGVALASGGHLLGIEQESLRVAAGTLMLLLGVVLLSSRMQDRFSRLAARLGARGYGALQNVHSDHPLAQFAVGGLMGVAWTPCVGPTLGAAIALAASGDGVASATAVMLCFSVAAVVPLTAAGLLSRGVFMRNRERLARAGHWGRIVMGVALVLVGALVLSGYDKLLESWLLERAPDWLTELTTRF